MKKIFAMIGAIFCLVTFSSQASLIYRFDNSEHPNVDFTGIEAAGFHILFGPDILHADDEFNLFIGETEGGNEISERLNISFALDWGGIGFGDTLNIIPSSDTFFVTFEILKGTFNLTSVTTQFIVGNDNEIFHGVPIRATAKDVPEPASVLIMLLGIFFIKFLSKANRNTSNTF